jgi:hypothetical protein
MIYLHESLIYLAPQKPRPAHAQAVEPHQPNVFYVTPARSRMSSKQRFNKMRIGTWFIATLVTLLWIACCLFAVTASAVDHADKGTVVFADEWRIFSDVVAPNGASHAIRFVRRDGSPFVVGTQFDFSLDGNTWSSINTPADSELGFFTPPKGVNFYIRVRTPEKLRDGSLVAFEQVKQFWLPVGHTAATSPMTWPPIE